MFEHFESRVGELRAGAGRAVLDFLYPPLCMTCRALVREPGNFCSSCWQAIGFLDGPMCACCGLPFDFEVGPDTLCAGCIARQPAFDRARSVMRYDNASRASILALKRADRLDLAPAFARLLERAGHDFFSSADMITPVPLHRRRLWSRRYNQSALLAGGLGKLVGKRVDTVTLQRTRSTPSQGDMVSAKARRRNVRGAFKAGREASGKTVLLIDDVLTTGATADACSRALKRAGATRIFVLTLARVVRPL
jgi:ComF family protein